MKSSFRINDHDSKPGHLVIIGGGYRPEYLMREFIRLAGGPESQITIVPSASHFPEQRAREVKAELEQLGCKNINYILAFQGLADVPENLNKLEHTRGIFFTGGDQNKLTALIQGTEVLKSIKNIYREGGVIAGTSAGAAIMSRIMIAGYDPDWDDSIDLACNLNVIPRKVRLSEGFGFLNNIIIDQHFNTRKRTDRLKAAVIKNPGMMGIGIDESTAIIVHGEDAFRVIGENNVTLFTLREFGLIQRTNNNANHIGKGEILTMAEGDKYLFSNFAVN
ncbi:MAG: cyanophycinase [Syntrophothermus sp.]